ncbi:Uncharacterised protein, partial [Mycoplasma putrefaciens]
MASGHIDFFGSKGLLTNLVSGFKNIILSVSDILGTISNYIKHIFYRGKEQSFDFKSAFTNLSNLLKVSNSLLEAQYVADSNREDDLVIYLGLGPHSIAKVYSIYDVLNLPHASVFSNPIIGSLVKKYTGKYLEPFLGVLKKLKDYKFITEVEKFREDFPKYILNSANFIETYYNKNEAIPKYDLIKYLYTKDQNFIANFTKQW